MKNHQILGTIFLTVLLTALTGFALANWIPWCNPVTQKSCKLGVTEWAYWVGAIGTVGTLIGTMWIATIETRRRRKQEAGLATVTATSLLVRQLKAMIAIKEVISTLRPGPAKFTGNDCTACSDKLKYAPTWTVEEIIPLLILPNNAAAELIRGREAIMHCKEELAWSSENDAPDMEHFFDELILQLESAYQAIQLAHSECKRYVYRE